MAGNLWLDLLKSVHRRAVWGQRPGPRPDDDRYWTLDGSLSAGNVPITRESTLSLPAYFQGIRLYADALGITPINPIGLTDKKRDRARVKLYDDPLYHLLRREPCPGWTPYRLKHTLMFSKGYTGNAYAFIDRNQLFAVKGLYPLPTERMTPKLLEVAPGQVPQLGYEYRPKDASLQPVTLPAWSVLHLRGPGDGLQGWSPLKLFARALSTGLAAEEYAARFFTNNATPRGFLRHPGGENAELSEESYQRMRESWERAHGGLPNAHRIAILEEGVEFQAMGFNAEEAQLLATRQFTIGDVGRMLNLPPHALHDYANAHFRNVEHMAIQLVTYSLLPEFTNWQEELSAKLIEPHRRATTWLEFDPAILLKGDVRTRFEAYGKAITDGWLNRDEVRARENLPPMPDGLGKVYVVTHQMQSAQSVAEETEGAQPAGAAPAATRATLPGPTGAVLHMETRASKRDPWARQQLGRSFRRSFRDLGRRIYLREQVDILKQARKVNLSADSLDTFIDWLDHEFYRRHVPWTLDRARDPFTTFAESVYNLAAGEVEADPAPPAELRDFLDEYLTRFARLEGYRSLGQLRKLLRETAAEDPAADLVATLDGRFEAWQDTRVGLMATEQTVTLQGRTAREAFILAGIVRLTWMAHGKSCPWCNALDGKTVGIERPFLDAGSYDIEGASSPLIVRQPAVTPSLHKGCDCVIGPA